MVLIIEQNFRIFLLLRVSCGRIGLLRSALSTAPIYEHKKLCGLLFTVSGRDAVPAYYDLSSSFSQRQISCKHVFVLLVLVRAASFLRGLKFGMYVVSHLRQVRAAISN